MKLTRVCIYQDAGSSLWIAERMEMKQGPMTLKAAGCEKKHGELFVFTHPKLLAVDLPLKSFADRKDVVAWFAEMRETGFTWEPNELPKLEGRPTSSATKPGSKEIPNTYKARAAKE